MTENDLGVVASPEMTEYFHTLKKGSFKAFKIAQKAREKGYDPEPNVSVTLAKTLAERVIGLISVIAPQVADAGVDKRIEELEEKYGVLDWRIAFIVAKEVAEQKFCKFEDNLEAITVGVRIGFAYLTLGVVSSPLEGLTSIELKKRIDGTGEYFCLNFAGPIRNAGGTAAAVCVLIADYVRNQLGYAVYDPTEKEKLRCNAELTDYHKYVTNLQYFPSEEESIFLMNNIPVEIAGDPSEKYEIANVALKDLPRVPTNQLRSGYCLIHSSCIPLKAPKIWKQLGNWGAEFQMEHWSFLEEFIKIQKKIKSEGKKSKKKEKISPDYTYIKDLVAGRPVLAYPLHPGGLRLRYGRSRVSGYSGQAINPASMHVLNNYIASATQLKVERPGKAAVYMPCNTIDGPIVKLKDGTVMYLESEKVAMKVKDSVKEILYIGDVLVNYGDFYDRNHNLVPVGYCQEWWIQDVEKSITEKEGKFTAETFNKMTGLPLERAGELIQNPLTVFPTAEEAIVIAKTTNTPLHSRWTFFWSLIEQEQLLQLLKGITSVDPLIITEEAKKALEILGIPHKKAIRDGRKIIQLDEGYDTALKFSLGLDTHTPTDIETKVERAEANVLDIVDDISSITIKDKAGTFIGARMGRPEKAKMRKMKGSPHCLFPVGEEGGRLRSFQEALVRGKITADFPLFYCKECKKQSVFSRCISCDKSTELQEREQTWYDGSSRMITAMKQQIPIKEIFRDCLKKLKFRIYPDLIKGVRGTSNSNHIPEHLIKGILRAKHEIAVNKDGTTRYDCSEVTLTHFKPEEIGVSLERLTELGYTKDIHGKPLAQGNQVLELKPQDIVIPCCPESPDEPADEILFRTTKFIDELLVKLYDKKAYYKLKTKEDLVGHLVVGLAPHTSAGIVGRIIGFSKTQGFLAHPLYHAAMRRDCDGDESCILLLMDVFLNFSRSYLPGTRGSTMDAPLVVTYILNPAAVDDMAFNVDRVWKYPREMYELAEEYKRPYDIDIDLIGNHLGKEEQFEGMGFTHDTKNINAGVLCSAYKILPSMQEKLQGQMDLAVKIRACDQSDVARLVIEKHFIRDTKGNLRKFSMQEWRCVKCNEKFRRPPLVGRCTTCNGKIIFTISEGSIVKYLDPSMSLATAYNVPQYLQQDLVLLKKRVEDVFGREKERQEGLGKWFG